MRDLVQATIAIVVVCALLFVAANQMQSASNKGSKDTLTVFNWGEYIDPELIAQFEEEISGRYQSRFVTRYHLIFEAAANGIEFRQQVSEQEYQE